MSGLRKRLAAAMFDFGCRLCTISLCNGEWDGSCRYLSHFIVMTCMIWDSTLATVLPVPHPRCVGWC